MGSGMRDSPNAIFGYLIGYLPEARLLSVPAVRQALRGEVVEQARQERREGVLL
jgi:hypothetical protein